MSSHSNIPLINVGIVAQPQLSFVLGGAFTSPEISDTISGECSVTFAGDCISLDRDGKRLGTFRSITLTPVSPESFFILKDVTIGVQFHWQRNEDQKFVGSLKLVPASGKVTAINVVSIEEYLTSVISSEMSAKSSMNLLRAHAITSRSWLIAQLEKSKELKSGGSKYQSLFETETERIRWYDREDHELFDVCADDHCQRYQGITKAYTASVKQAIDETRGMVVMYDGKVCDARFSKSCGGIMETFENAWEPVNVPYLAPIVDTASETTPLDHDFVSEANAEKWIRAAPEAFCNTHDKRVLSQVLLKYDQETTDFFRWQVSYTQDEMSEIIQRRSDIDFGKILDLVPVARGKSSRLTKLKIVGSNKTLTIGKELEIRRTLSNSHLYSSAIVFEKQAVENGVPRGFVLSGAGWGHGVGLCQIGAAVMGEHGYSYEKILLHYFPHTEIKTLY